MSRPAHHIIYVPGIHDDLYWFQSLLIRAWRLLGVHGHCHVMPWAGSEAYASKSGRLRAEFEHYAERGYDISLVGASAGASAVLNLYAEHPDRVRGVVLICPKLNHPETVGKDTYTANPAFRTALEALQITLKQLSASDKRQITTYFSPKDGVVPYADSHTSAIRERRLPAVRHGYAILYSLSLGAPGIVRRLKAPRA